MALKTFMVGKVQISSAVMAGVQNASFTINQDVAEVTDIGDTWKVHDTLAKGGTATITVQRNPADTAQAYLRVEMISGDCKVASVAMYEDATKYYKFSAILNSMTPGKSVNAVDTNTYNLTINGSVSYN